MYKRNTTIVLLTVPLFIFAALIFCSCEGNDISFEEQISVKADDAFDHILLNHQIIAHAGGGIDGETYTNSLEAIQLHYQNGTRIFEIDFMFTNDNEIVAVHYWEDIGEDFSSRNKPTLNEFKMNKIREIYTPLCLEQLLYLMRDEYTDILLVIDTKESNIKQFYANLISQANEVDIQLLNRIIPQIYNFTTLDYLKERSNNGFRHYILTLYKITAKPADVIEYLSKKEDIKYLVMTPNRYSHFNQEQINELKRLQIQVYLHTINNIDTALTYTDGYVKGVYSDYITENEYKQHFFSENE